MSEDERVDSPLTEAIVNIGTALHPQTVAEGIEEEGQVTQLHGLHCEYGQGFLFGKPLPAADCQAVLTELALPREAVGDPR